MVHSAVDAELAIETQGFEKIYRKGRVHALQNINLQVPTGCVFGLLGPNGAGKSTLVKSLLTIVRATSGAARIYGEDHRNPHARAGVGYLPEGHRFPRYLTGEGVCHYFGRLAGLSGRELVETTREKLALVGMGDWARTKISRYSKGMAQRVGLAQALLGNPRLVILDEPTDGVDPIGRKEIRDVIRRIAGEQGCTVFVNSHLLQEIELMCDQVAIMHQGQIIQQGTVSDIRQRLSEGTGIRVRVTIGIIGDQLWTSLQQRGARTIVQGQFEMPLNSRDEVSALIDELRQAAVSIYGINLIELSLEDIFMQVIGAQPNSGVGGTSLA